MKRNVLIFSCLIGLAALAVAGVTHGQLSNLRPRDGENSIQLEKGQQVFLHGSHDTVIEVLVDLPMTSAETVKYYDLDSGKMYPLPNGSIIRLQGRVLLGRDQDGQSVGKPNVRWSYVNSMFTSFSRQPRR